MCRTDFLIYTSVCKWIMRPCLLRYATVRLETSTCQGMGDFYFLMFNFYIAFCVVGLFNVVTGVFVAAWSRMSLAK